MFCPTILRAIWWKSANGNRFALWHNERTSNEIAKVLHKLFPIQKLSSFENSLKHMPLIAKDYIFPDIPFPSWNTHILRFAFGTVDAYGLNLAFGLLVEMCGQNCERRIFQRTSVWYSAGFSCNFMGYINLNMIANQFFTSKNRESNKIHPSTNKSSYTHWHHINFVIFNIDIVSDVAAISLNDNNLNQPISLCIHSKWVDKIFVICLPIYDISSNFGFSMRCESERARARQRERHWASKICYITWILLI